MAVEGVAETATVTGRGTTIGVIPARFASTRFPGKLLAPLFGTPVILHVLDRARRVRGLDRLLVATDDERIAEVVRGAGGEAEMTSSRHPSGTDRIGEVLGRLRPAPEYVLNLQGDEPFFSPRAVERLLQALWREGDAIWTLAEPITDESEYASRDVVKVVCADDGRALYFSRAGVPCFRGGWNVSERALRHVGVYAYPRALLSRFLALPPGVLESAEGLEQLRALEHGMMIRVQVGAWPHAAVDTPEDLERIGRLYPGGRDPDAGD